MELVSVIIPVYNGEKYLRECVDSILANTYSNLEIILVDDGSADTTARICGEYAKNIPIDCLFTRKIKACRACNAGFDVAQETYNF